MIARNTAFCALAGITRYQAVFGGIRPRYFAVSGDIWRYLADIAQLPLTTCLICLSHGFYQEFACTQI